MNNKNIPTCLGTAILVIIAITAGAFVWVYEKGQNLNTTETTTVQSKTIQKEATKPDEQKNSDVKTIITEPTENKNNCLNRKNETRICKDGSVVEAFDQKCSPQTCTDNTVEMHYYSPFIKNDHAIFVEGPTYDTGLISVIGADADSFKFVGTCATVEKSGAFYGKDKNFIYIGDKKAESIDTKSFEYLGVFSNGDGMPYSVSVSTDKANVYFGCGIPIKSIDRNSFVVFENGYSKDNKHVYYLNQILSKADNKTFKIIKYTPTDGIYGNFALDKNYVFFEGRILKDINPMMCKTLDLKTCLPKNWHDLFSYDEELERFPNKI